MRLLRQGVAGLSQVGSPQNSASRRISGLRQPALGQGAPHLSLGRRLQARTVLAVVVAIAAVGHHRHVQPPRQLLHLGEQLALAVVAAVRLVGLIGGDGQLVGGDHFVTDADLPGEFSRLVQLAGGQAGALAGDGHGAIAQGQLGRLGQHRAVQSAGERHGATAVAAQQVQQSVALGGEFGRKVGHGEFSVVSFQFVRLPARTEN